MTYMENDQRPESRGTADQDPESKHASIRSAELLKAGSPKSEDEDGPTQNGSMPLPHFDVAVDGGINGWMTVAGS
jgi:hypothetical protein